MTWHKTIFGITFIIILSGCASKFAPVVSRPDNLVIECETKCKFNIPMNTEIIVAKNTNGWDALKDGIRQIPFIGALALSWKSMDVAENIADSAIESFNRGAGNVTTTTNTTTSSSTVGATTTTGDTTNTTGDTGSGNTSTGDTSTTGDTVDSSGSGNTSHDGSENTTTTETEYNNSFNETDQSNNSNQNNVPPPP